MEPTSQRTDGGIGGPTKVLGLRPNVAAALAYLPFFVPCVGVVLAALWLATEPRESRFVRVHALQALLLHVLSWFSLGGCGCCTSLASGVVHGHALGVVVAMLLRIGEALFAGAIVIVFLVGLAKALGGQELRLPLLGEIAQNA